MAILDSTTANWSKLFTITKATTSVYTLQTAGKYVEKDIKLTMNVRSATVTLAVPGSATISSINIGYNSTAGNFSATGSASLTGTATLGVTQAGWIGSGSTAAISGSSTLSATIPKIGIKADISGTTSVTPVINRSTATTAGATNVGTQNATTSAPASGYFIAVQSAAATNTITATPSVIAAGYGGTTSDQWTGTNGSASVGANASALTYIPIDAVSATLAGAASASVNGISFAKTNGANTFDVTLTGNIIGSTTMTVSRPGWLAGNVNGSISGSTISTSAKVNMVGVGADFSGTTKVTPMISSVSVPSGVTNAIDGSVTTSAPSSGVYVAVQSTATTANISVNPKVITDGYGTTTNFSATSSTTAIGANASSVTYAKIKTGSAAANTATVSIAKYTTDGSNPGVNIAPIIGTMATSEPTAGYYVAFSATGSGSSKITSAGWMSTGALDAATTNTTCYFPVTTATISVTGGGLTKGNGAVSMANKGYYNGTSYDTSDIIDITSQGSLASGYYVLEATGSGSVSRGAINKQVTTAGYAPKDDSAVQQISQATTSSNVATATYYIKKSTFSSTSVNSSNTSQTITIDAGYYPSARTVSIAGMSSASVTTTYAQSGMGTYFTTQSTSTGASVTITPQYTNTAGYLAAHSSAVNNGGVGYWKIKTYSTTTTNASVSDTTFTQGTFTIKSGWVGSNTTLTGATFANTATSGTSYTDISDTTGSPILVSGDYLYINAGYTGNVKISLKKLVPDGANITTATTTTTNQILSGYMAYNSDGVLLAGTIPTRSAANMTVNGQSISIAEGYYPDAVTKSVGTATPAFKGGALTSTAATATSITNITTTATNTGISFTPTGKAGRTAVLYDGAVEGWVSVANNTTASAAVSQTTWNGSPIYISGITVPKDKPFTLTTVADTALDATSDITINNAAYRQLKITNAANGDIDITNSGRTDITVGSSSAGIVSVSAYPKGTGTTIVAAKTIVSGGRWAADSGTITPTDAVQGPFYGEIYVNPMSSGTSAVVTSGKGTVSVGNPTYDSSGNNFTISITGTVAVPSVGTAGYISSSVGTKNGNTITAATKTLTKVGLGTDLTNGGARTPAISKVDVPSGVTNAASGAATTATPSSGVYVAVQSAANTATLTATAKVTTAGYGTSTTGQYNVVAATTTVGAAQSALTYVPIKVATTASTAGTAAATGGTASVGVEGMVTTSTNTGYRVSATATGGSASTTTGTLSISDGYVTSATTLTLAAKSASGANSNTAVYIQKGVLSASVSSNTSGSASIAASGFTALTGTNTSSYYVTLSTTAGSIKAKASVATEGYVKSESNETSATTVSVTGNGNKLYIPTATATGSVVDLTAPSATATMAACSDITTTSTNTNYYITLSSTTAAGSVKGKATVAGTGMVANGTSHTSTASSVGITVNMPTTRINIPAATITFTGGTVSATATASFVNSGNKIISTAVTDASNNGLLITASATANRAIATYTNTAGYFPAHTSAQTAVAASGNVAATTTGYYLQGVRLAAPSSGTATFFIEVPNGSTSEFIKFMFHVDTSGNVYVDDGTT